MLFRSKMIGSGAKSKYPQVNAMVVSRIQAMMKIGVPVTYDRIFCWLQSYDLEEMKPKPDFKHILGWYLSLAKRHHWSNRVFTQNLGITL